MSRRVTVVVGAGANARFDRNGSMPVGSQLANRIQALVRSELRSSGGLPQGDFSSALSHQVTGFSSKHADAMRKIEAGITSKESIDEFIDEWSDFPLISEVGKAAIAFEILNSERGTEYAIKSDDILGISECLTYTRESWLGLVLRLANPGCPRRNFLETLSGVRFITFNYDRYLEILLFHYAKHTLGFAPDEAARLVSKVPIYHVYGSLGPLPEMNLGIGIPFGGEGAYSVPASQNIRTFTEDVDSHFAATVRSIMAEPGIILFLGFGFHQRNLDLLFDENGELAEGVSVWGTCKGVRPQRRSVINNQLRPKGMPFELQESDCEQLIWERQDEIFG